VRYALVVFFLASAPIAAQDLPDPGRRLDKPEQKSDRSKPQGTGPFDPLPEPRRNERACEGARQNYQLSCRSMISPMASSQACAEAYAIYRQACP
jgi:hypothetical protein